jgi:NAD(P)-dependent dehydrogenase (short-subunit alcohol dehydrogenase family)
MPQRNWLITGVTSGFGRIMTEQLLARGDRIAGTVCNLSLVARAPGTRSHRSPDAAGLRKAVCEAAQE